MSSDISSSLTLRERSAAAWSSSGERQPSRRRMTYRSMGILLSSWFQPDGESRRDLPALRRRDLDAELGERLLCGLLLRRLLRLAGTDAQLLPVDHGGAGEAAVMRGSLDLQHRVADRLAPAREGFL